MKRRFLLRFDGAKDNDEFFARRRALPETTAYSGTSLSVGAAWIPDLLEIEVSESNEIGVTLIELEAAESTAKVSCRKYLPEPSSEVMRSLNLYLDAVVRQTLATADSRYDDFKWLQSRFGAASRVHVSTAGALRTGERFIEMHSLLDQPDRISVRSATPPMPPSPRAFNGLRSFSREEVDGLRRAARVLHAVAVGRDHSSATLHSWHNIRTKPLDIEVSKDPARSPQLHHLLGKTSRSGAKLDCGRLASELADLWGATAHPRSASEVAQALERFFPKAISFSGKDPMEDVFAAARESLG